MTVWSIVKSQLSIVELLNLNLLSKEDLSNVKFEEWRRLATFVFFAAIFIIFIFIAVLLPVYFSVTAERRAVSESLKNFESSSSGIGIRSVETKVASLNKLFKDIIRRGAANRNVSGIINRLITDSNNRILFSSISYRKDKEIYITGFASTRQDLINFEKKLHEYENLKEISLPVSNLIKETNINFSIRAIPTF